MRATITAFVLALLVVADRFRVNGFGGSPILKSPRSSFATILPTRVTLAGSIAGSRLTGKACGRSDSFRYCSLQTSLGLIGKQVQPSIDGLVAGGFHSITGPDHVAVVLAASVGKSALEGLKLGALWGAGHGLALVGMGGAGYFLKDRLARQYAALDQASHFATALTGLSLVVVGLLGVKECLENDGEQHQSTVKPKQTGIALLVNGVIHGLCWSGLPGLVPAMAMPSWTEAMHYLSCYALGTVGAMSLSAAAVSAVSTHVGKMTSDPHLPRRLSLFSSLFAVGVGLWWGLRAWTGR